MAEQSSPRAKSSNIGKYLLLGCLCIALIGIGAWFVLRTGVTPSKPLQPAPATGEKKVGKIPSDKVIDYDKLQKNDQELIAKMEKRKAPYGVEKSIDMIVRSDESIKVGNKTVPMQDILDKVRLRQGEIVEKDLGDKGDFQKDWEVFGVHVVRSSENIWDIHFNLLQDHYKAKGIHLSPLSDEPDRMGYSTGVGKILKFSENLVHIYNIRDRRLEDDLNLIHPLGKVVIYNMGRVFALLDRIDYKDVNRIEFDGQNLWLRAVQ